MKSARLVYQERRRAHQPAALLVFLLLAACAAPPPRTGLERPSADGFEPVLRQGAVLYRIEPQTSEIRVLVYRGGALANLGHNHVIALRPARGWIAAATAPKDSALRLEFPLDSVIIDDAAMRAQEGADFPGVIEDSAISGTRHNMVGDALLDAAHFPVVSVRSVAVTPGSGETPAERLDIKLRFTVAGRDSEFLVPVRLERVEGGMIASGQFSLRQSELGLKPFSIMLGALQVQDQMTVKFRITARRAGGQGSSRSAVGAASQ